MESSSLRVREFIKDNLSIALSVLAVSYIALLTAQEIESVVSPAPFSPLRPNELVVEESFVKVNGSVTVHDGICNDSKDTYALNIHAFFQSEREVDGKLMLGPTYDIYGSNEVPAVRTLQPRECFATQIVPVSLRPGMQEGVYRVAYVAFTRGSDGKRQDLSESSNTFRVIP